MVDSLKFSALVGTDHSSGRLVSRLHREGRIIQACQRSGPLDGGLDARLGAEVHPYQGSLFSLQGLRLS
jgi:hypothetical protein